MLHLPGIIPSSSFTAAASDVRAAVGVGPGRHGHAAVLADVAAQLGARKPATAYTYTPQHGKRSWWVALL